MPIFFWQLTFPNFIFAYQHAEALTKARTTELMLVGSMIQSEEYYSFSLQEDEKTPKDIDFWLEDLYTPGFDSLLKKKEAEHKRKKLCKIICSIILSVCTVLIVVIVPVVVLQNKNWWCRHCIVQLLGPHLFVSGGQIFFRFLFRLDGTWLGKLSGVIMDVKTTLSGSWVYAAHPMASTVAAAPLWKYCTVELTSGDEWKCKIKFLLTSSGLTLLQRCTVSRLISTISPTEHTSDRTYPQRGSMKVWITTTHRSIVADHVHHFMATVLISYSAE